ncbi:MAG: tRNA (adenosine(37)-N6)-threonylcarbamoyltransferase complex ATPase subunit type 1 TsaE [Halioglobus sp.]|nr:tRNA (adenosine(37)-N6)-threonylcarbamoyltransferase complex ATPase subunit type 1 TsaE [Halioglobus sp.]
MTVTERSLFAADESSMVAIGAALAAACEAGLVLFLEGELGMGKTTLARGFVQALGHDGAVKSPTYTLVEPYEMEDRSVYHFDLYRLGDPEELELMGIRDYFGENSVCLVEWPGRGLGVLPGPDIVIRIVSEGSGRRLALEAATDRGRSVLARLGAADG